MKLSLQSTLAIRSALKEATARFAVEDLSSKFTDFHVQAKSDNGELTIYDDDENELSKCIVEEWADAPESEMRHSVENSVKTELAEINKDGYLENLNIIKPYSFVLVDDNMETIAELLLVDDEKLIVSDELMKGLDDELNDFLKKIMEE